MNYLFPYKSVKFIGTLLLFTLTMFACKREGCTDPNATNYDAKADEDDGSCITDTSGTHDHGSHDHGSHDHSNDSGHAIVRLSVIPKWGAQNFTLGTNYDLGQGRMLQISRLQFYASGFVFPQTGSTSTSPHYALIVPHADNTYIIGQLAAGHYHGVTLNLGVDSGANETDPETYSSDHALSRHQANFSHGGDGFGYYFAHLQGWVDTAQTVSGTLDAPLEIRTGTLDLLRTISITHHFDAVTGDTLTIPLVLDVSALFDGVDLTSGYQTQTTDDLPLATAIQDNLSQAFSTN